MPGPKAVGRGSRAPADPTDNLVDNRPTSAGTCFTSAGATVNCWPTPTILGLVFEQLRRTLPLGKYGAPPRNAAAVIPRRHRPIPPPGPKNFPILGVWGGAAATPPPKSKTGIIRRRAPFLPPQITSAGRKNAKITNLCQPLPSAPQKPMLILNRGLSQAA